MIENMMDQLSHLTMGEIADLTEQKKTNLNELKYFSDKVEEAAEEFNAQDFIDSADTKIKGDFFK